MLNHRVCPFFILALFLFSPFLAKLIKKWPLVTSTGQAGSHKNLFSWLHKLSGILRLLEASDQ